MQMCNIFSLFSFFSFKNIELFTILQSVSTFLVRNMKIYSVFSHYLLFFIRNIQTFFIFCQFIHFHLHIWKCVLSYHYLVYDMLVQSWSSATHYASSCTVGPWSIPMLGNTTAGYWSGHPSLHTAPLILCFLITEVSS